MIVDRKVLAARHAMWLKSNRENPSAIRVHCRSGFGHLRAATGSAATPRPIGAEQAQGASLENKLGRDRLAIRERDFEGLNQVKIEAGKRILAWVRPCHGGPDHGNENGVRGWLGNLHDSGP